MAPYICVVADVRVRLRAPSFVAVHLGALRIGACMAETNWSVRGWMQDKKFNTHRELLLAIDEMALELERRWSTRGGVHTVGGPYFA